MNLRLVLAGILLTISPVFFLPTPVFALTCYTNTGSPVITNGTTCFPGTSATMPNNIYTQTNPPVTNTPAPTPAPTTQTTASQPTQTTSNTANQRGQTAASSGNSGGLVQCGNPGQPACNICSLLALIQILINYAIDLAFAFAGLFIAWGAFVIMTAGGSEEKVKKGKEVMTTAIVGLVIMLSAWLILGTVLQVLTGSATKLPWTSITCTY